MNRLTALIIAASCLALSPLHAQNSILKNGDFERSLAQDKWLDGWFNSSPEPGTDQWVTTVDLDDGGRAVEIKGDASASPLRSLCQDVRLEEGGQTGKRYILRCRAKGQGTASISALPRDIHDEFFKAAGKKFDLSDAFETQEIPVDIPDDAGFVRVILAPQDDSVVVFAHVELVPE